MLLRLILLCAAVSAIASPVSAQGSPLSRPLTLRQRTLRIDVGPSDWGYMDHGALNDSRGVRIRDEGENADTSVWLGAGFAYGAGRNVEVGALVLPLLLSPESKVGDLELYGRYGLTSELALQATLQLPTDTDVGIGMGMPIRLRLGRSRLDTGFELEIIFEEDSTVNLDVPLAVSVPVTNTAYVGFRSGFVFWDMEDVAINLGAQGGVSVTRAVDFTVGLNFPRFLWTGPGDSVNLEPWELIFGMNLTTGV